jgi:hypothetical protein
MTDNPLFGMVYENRKHFDVGELKDQYMFLVIVPKSKREGLYLGISEHFLITTVYIYILQKLPFLFLCI